MARRLTLMVAMALLAVSCGVNGQYASSQRFQDGIYYKGFDKDMQKVEPLSEEDFQRLAAEQIRREQNNQGRRDTLVVVYDDFYSPHFGWYGGWRHGWYGGWR